MGSHPKATSRLNYTTHPTTQKNTPKMKDLPNPGSTFKLRKEKILSQLSVPDEQYTDASPKGSVDAGIRHLIAQINAHAGLVTTSSCAGRVSVYLEGRKSAAGGKGPAPDDGQREMPEGGESQSRRRIGGGGGGNANGNAGSSAGGKGGGEWLFVSHDPVPGGAHDAGYGWLLGSGPRQVGEETGQDAVDSAEAPRLIHFKFEPMVCFAHLYGYAVKANGSPDFARLDGLARTCAACDPGGNGGRLSRNRSRQLAQAATGRGSNANGCREVNGSVL